MIGAKDEFFIIIHSIQKINSILDYNIKLQKSKDLLRLTNKIVTFVVKFSYCVSIIICDIIY